MKNIAQLTAGDIAYRVSDYEFIEVEITKVTLTEIEE